MKKVLIFKNTNMKRILFLTVYIVFSLSSFAQWTPQQTEWYYPEPVNGDCNIWIRNL
jgi:hypothetical protein